MKLLKSTTLSLSLMAIVMGAVSCTPVKRVNMPPEVPTIFCDDGFKNILDEEIEVFEYSYPTPQSYLSTSARGRLSTP